MQGDARGCPTPRAAGRSLRPSWAPFARSWLRFGFLPALANYAGSRGIGQPLHRIGEGYCLFVAVHGAVRRISGIDSTGTLADVPGMRLYPCDRYPLPLPPGHRFPIDKYSLLHRRLERHAAEGAALEFIEPHAATDDELRRVHCPEYLGRVMSGTLSPAEVRRIGFPWSEQLVARSLRSTGAAVDAAAAAVADGVAASLAGGTHHAGTDWGEGYCVFNDTAVAARELQARGVIGRALILDCDVHQGNGTAEIFKADPTVFTMSIHGARNFPARKHPGSLDVGLEDGTGDEEYLRALAGALAESFDRARADLVLYIAGADPYRGDRIGRLGLSKEGLLERDRMVLAAARAARTPVAIVCGGGYCEDLESIVDIHAATMLLAAGAIA